MIIEGKIVWPRLFKAEKYKETDKEPKFSCSILIPKGTEQAKKLMEEVKRLIATELKGAEIENRYMPVKDGDKNKDENFHGCLEIRCKAKETQRPGVVDGNLDPILDPSKIVGGDEVRADIGIYAYDSAATGIGIAVNNAQWLCKGDTPIGGARQRAEDVFEKIGGGSSKSVDDFLA